MYRHLSLPEPIPVVYLFLFPDRCHDKPQSATLSLPKKEMNDRCKRTIKLFSHTSVTARQSLSFCFELNSQTDQLSFALFCVLCWHMILMWDIDSDHIQIRHLKSANTSHLQTYILLMTKNMNRPKIHFTILLCKWTATCRFYCIIINDVCISYVQCALCTVHCVVATNLSEPVFILLLYSLFFFFLFVISWFSIRELNQRVLHIRIAFGLNHFHSKWLNLLATGVWWPFAVLLFCCSLFLSSLPISPMVSRVF